MSAHHLLNENDMKKKCLYCGNELDICEWESQHYVEKHYKTNSCTTCGKEAIVEVGFEGSGHDSWAAPFNTKKQRRHKGKIKVVESQLEKVIKEA
ncbi:MAG: hypothetical protein ACOCZ6_04035 [Nanoarchaeota archaeon]